MTHTTETEILPRTAGSRPGRGRTLAVSIGPAEELFFRGAVQGNLRTAFGPVTAVGVTSLLFGGVHVAGFSRPASPSRRQSSGASR